VQALTVLSTNISDPLFNQRMFQNFDYLITQFSTCNRTSKSFVFFEFIEDFVREMHNNFTTDNLKEFLQSLVDRILSELNLIKEKQSQKQGKTLDLTKKQISVSKKSQGVKAVDSAL
jgi:hypothetical protein